MDPRKIHPALADRDAFRKKMEAEPLTPATPPAAPPAVPEADPLPPATFVPDAPPAPPAAPPPPVQPQIQVVQDPAVVAELAAVKAQLAAERQAAIERDKKVAELEEIKRQQELEKEIQFAEGELSGVENSDARLIAQAAARAAELRMAKVKEDLMKEWQEAQAKERAASTAQTAQAQAARSAMDMEQRVLAEVPDFASLIKTSTYNEYMNQKLEDGRTRLSHLQASYQTGNVDYIIRALKQVKAAIPDLDGVARVGATAPGTSAATQVPSGESSKDLSTTADLVDKVARGEISPSVFREMRLKQQQGSATPK